MWLSTPGAVFNLLGLWLLPRRKYAAMACYLVSSACFFVWAVIEREPAIAALQTVLIALNARTIIIWRNDERESDEDTNV